MMSAVPSSDTATADFGVLLQGGYNGVWPLAAGAYPQRFRATGIGWAIGIGHPHPATLAVLEQWLPRLAQHNIRLIPFSTLLALTQQEVAPWQASLSP